MTAKIKVKYANGVLTPLEPLELEDGAEVSVTVEDSATRNVEVVVASSADGRPVEVGKDDEGPGARMLRRIEKMRKEIPIEAWDVLPRDLAKNKKHYLYGHPNEDD